MASPVPHPKDRALALVTLGNNGGLQTDAALEESGRACYGFLTFILRLPQITVDVKCNETQIQAVHWLHPDLRCIDMWIHTESRLIFQGQRSSSPSWAQLLSGWRNPLRTRKYQPIINPWIELRDDTFIKKLVTITNYIQLIIYTKNLENDLLFGGKYMKIPIGQLNPTF